MCVVRDVTQGKRMEAALRESEARLRFHLENTPLAVIEWDADFVVTRWAGDAESLFGWSAAETVGKPIMDLGLVVDDDLPLVEKTMAELTDGEHSQVVSSNRDMTKDGRVIDCTWFNSVLMDEQGRMSSVMSLVQDDTERKRAEAALRESEESLSLALKVGGIATWDFRVDTGAVVWNREHYLMLGYEPGQVEAGATRCFSPACTPRMRRRSTRRSSTRSTTARTTSPTSASCGRMAQCAPSAPSGTSRWTPEALRSASTALCST